MAQRWFGAESALLILSVLCVRAPAALANASITSSPIGPRTAGSRPVGTLFTSANSGSGSQVPIALLPAAAEIPFAGRTLALELTPIFFGSDSSAAVYDPLWRVTASDPTVCPQAISLDSPTFPSSSPPSTGPQPDGGRSLKSDCSTLRIRITQHQFTNGWTGLRALRGTDLKRLAVAFE